MRSRMGYPIFIRSVGIAYPANAFVLLSTGLAFARVNAVVSKPADTSWPRQ